MRSIHRRDFIRQAAIVSLGFTGLWSCGRIVKDQPKEIISDFGPLLPDPNQYLDLPKGFHYRLISKAGNKMDDGLFVPARPDGMATFSGPDGRVIIIRNHENSPTPKKYGPFGKNHELLDLVDPQLFYDYGKGKTPGIGGTTTLVYNEETGEVEREFLSLVGTYRNCAGGPTPWGTWISCEEDVAPAGNNVEKNHGFAFEVPVSTEIKLHRAVPITGMGRFNHEAICVDPKTGIVYQTEDRSNGLVYRYIPHVKGELLKGGKLQILALKEAPKFDTRNWDAQKMALDQAYDVEWLDIDNILAPKDDLRYRGYKQGAARFARGEGMWFGQDELYFACTKGGPQKLGQVFKYVPSPYEGTPGENNTPGQLILFAESTDETIFNHCDNLTVAPWGDIILCEDNGEVNFIKGITPEGKIYDFGQNMVSNSEFAGVTFSPSGKTLFVNIQGDGDTLAITGPWKQTSQAVS